MALAPAPVGTTIELFIRLVERGGQLFERLLFLFFGFLEPLPVANYTGRRVRNIVSSVRLVDRECGADAAVFRVGVGVPA